ncbi:Choline kinase [Limimonas halophila]|uniref:Choline kinase n=1 Tax=Limimonas halophila TaxID=1082479 RepID=A0A1G7PQ87_9PROT|nr:phosphocholine cytidylyltransferase family protein [Limimonas halophila]SDF88381.1 Choline kinase [Limimonas halophila]
MKTVILSAGQGKRLLPLTERAPKALVEVAPETTILGWQLDQLAAAGVDDVTVVTGFAADQVETALARAPAGMRARTLYNPFCAVADNLSSVWLALDALGDDGIVLNGDTLFAAPVARRLIAAETPATVVISRKDGYDTDDMKVSLDGERLAAVGKQLDSGVVDAESIGMMRFRGEGMARFRAAVRDAMRREDALRVWYLSVVDAMARQGGVSVTEAGADEWCEVDFPADLTHAREALARWRASVSPGRAATGT